MRPVIVCDNRVFFLSEGGTEDERKHEDRPLGGKAAKAGGPQTIQLRSTAEDPPPDLEAAAATKLKQRAD